MITLNCLARISLKTGKIKKGWASASRQELAATGVKIVSTIRKRDQGFIMHQPENLLMVYQQYCECLQKTGALNQSKNLINETQTAIFRYTALGLGFANKPKGYKMSPDEVAATQKFLSSVGIEKVVELREAQKRGFDELGASIHARNTYEARLDNFLTWIDQQPWWSNFTTEPSLKRSCLRFRQGYGSAQANKLTGRDFAYQSYQLQSEQILPALKADLAEFHRFMVAAEYPGRCTTTVDESSAQIYLKHIRLILGWFHNSQKIPLESLSLELLIPHLSEEDLEDLNPGEKEEYLRVKKLEFETWLCNYFDFLAVELQALSPHTRKTKLNSLAKLGRFIYRDDVDFKKDYNQIPILKVISKYSRLAKQEIKERQNQGLRVVDLEKKWPPLVDKQTALATVRQQVLEPLRLQTFSRYDNGHLRSGSAIALSQQRYLIWSFLADMPARRQEEFCHLKVALSCPRERPEKVPADGLYHPLPRQELRELESDGSFAYNYLHKTYQCQDKFYPEGVWVLDVQRYKTDGTYGSQSVIIPNRYFNDGTCLYDYLENYLYGWWQSEQSNSLSHASNWQAYIAGEAGQWLTLGRNEFFALSAYQQSTVENHWYATYFFVKSQKGKPYDPKRSSFSAFVSKAAHGEYGKRTTPHVMRYVWATWAFQVGLSDQQIESLAYAMGHDVQTLREMYDQCSPDEKRRPIEETIDQLLFADFGIEKRTDKEGKIDLEKLAASLQKLPNLERQSLIAELLASIPPQKEGDSAMIDLFPQNLFEVYEQYIRHIQETQAETTASYTRGETWRALVNSVLVGLGSPYFPKGAKMTLEEEQVVRDFMKAQGVEVLSEARAAQCRGFQQVNRSLRFQEISTYRLEMFLRWCQEQPWWIGEQLLVDYHENLCCPEAYSDKSSTGRKKLTQRSGACRSYRVKPSEMNSHLVEELQDHKKFMTEPNYPGRVIRKVAISTYENASGTICQILGWFHRYQNVPLEQLNFGLLIPYLSKSNLKDLKPRQQRKLWKEKTQAVEQWLCNFLKFQREVMQSKSPNTRRTVLTDLVYLGKYQYRYEVEDIDDYDHIPVMKVVKKYQTQFNSDSASWRASGKSFYTQDDKWPNPVPGQTALTTVQQQVVEPLRFRCRPKNSAGKMLPSREIATAHARYLAWHFLANMPARRVEEYSSLKISLCCPLKRPDEVPTDGFYHPLPSAQVREKQSNGMLADNYLYKTYFHQGKHYPEGIWILDIYAHKNWNTYGHQAIVIKNRQYADGRSLYDHIEHYLYGWWLPGGRKHQRLYDWWSPELQGRRGRWVTKGRGEFEPLESGCALTPVDSTQWSWGYLFVGSVNGQPSQLSGLVGNAANQLIDKQTTPHTMRYVWATWAFQVGLDDRQKESLAYAMGHKLEVMKKMYERCSAAERRRPIEEAISELLFNEVIAEESVDATAKVERWRLTLKKLTLPQRRKLVKLLDLD